VYPNTDLARLKMAEIERDIEQNRLVSIVRRAAACCEAAAVGLIERLARAVRPRPVACSPDPDAAGC
jgi:hypothetical protein